MCERGKENERGLRPLSLRTPLSGAVIKEIEEKIARTHHIQRTKTDNTHILTRSSTIGNIVAFCYANK
jgi:hypothetical protein